MERYDEALEAYKHIREALPNESLGYTGAAQVLRQMGNPAEAKAMTDEWQKILAARRARGRGATRPATRVSK
jgi:predicted Zn-dependent protease